MCNTFIQSRTFPSINPGKVFARFIIFFYNKTFNYYIMTKTRRAGFSKKRRRGGRKTVKRRAVKRRAGRRRAGRRRSRGTKGGSNYFKTANRRYWESGKKSDSASGSNYFKTANRRYWE